MSIRERFRESRRSAAWRFLRCNLVPGALGWLFWNVSCVVGVLLERSPRVAGGKEVNIVRK